MKTNTLLLIGGVAALGGMLVYFSKNKKEETQNAILPTTAQLVKESTISTDITKPLNTNTGINPATPLAITASKPLVAAESNALTPSSSGLKPAAGVMKDIKKPVLTVVNKAQLSGPFVMMYN